MLLPNFKDKSADIRSNLNIISYNRTWPYWKRCEAYFFLKCAVSSLWETHYGLKLKAKSICDLIYFITCISSINIFVKCYVQIYIVALIILFQVFFNFI